MTMRDSLANDDTCITVLGQADPSLAHLSEAELAARSAAEPHAAALSAELCARFAHRVRICSRHHLHSAVLADDVSRHVLAVVLRKIHGGTIREPEHIASVVLAVTRTAVQDVVCTGPTGLTVRATPRNSTPASREDTAGYWELLVRGLERLEGSEVDVLIGTYIGAQRPEHLARAAGVDVEETRRLRWRAIERLQHALGRDSRESRTCTVLKSADFADYLAGDLSVVREAAIETHFFDCAVCAESLDVLDRVCQDLIIVLRHAATPASITRAALDRISQSGAKLRRHVLAPGDAITCCAPPDDDFLVIELLSDFAGATRIVVTLSLDALDVSAPPVRRTQPVLVDRARQAIILLFPAAVIHAWRATRWTLQVRMAESSGPWPTYTVHVPPHR
jgi:hypothetical protein